METPRRFRWFLALWLLVTGTTFATAEVTFLLSAPRDAMSGRNVRVWLMALNDGPGSVDFEFAPHLDVGLASKASSGAASLPYADAQPARVKLAPGEFQRREYAGPVPELTRGPLEVSFGVSRIILHPAGQAPVPATPNSPTNSVVTMKSEPEPAPSVQEESALLRFFKAHFEPYEANYFIAGFDQPNAKFQFSFRYRVFNEDGWIPNQVPALGRIYFAYTQTSLWDWESESAPFKDSSYKPEVQYVWRDVFKAGERGHGARWDLEAGLMHESNGRDGVDSRSMNLAYLRPRVTFGQPGDFQVSLAPRAWVYLSDVQGRHTLANIPVGDPLERYRGYVDLRVTAGWRDYLLLSALARLGDEGDRASLTLDASYPLKSLPFGTFAGYFHVQYFTGYGESLLDYDVRSDTIRFGFSLSR